MLVQISSVWQVLGVAVTGLVAGTLGGMLGVGGSIIMIPGMALLFGVGANQHLYQASAMIANVAVSVPAARRHARAGALVGRAVRWMLPTALLFVLMGVWVSNRRLFEGHDGGTWLGRVLAVFLLYVIALNVWRLLRAEAEPVGESHVTAPRSLAVGSVMGAVAGLLGIGGGAVAVPLQQVSLRLPLRSCIANSSAIICLSASFGAAYKVATLAQHYPGAAAWRQSLLLAVVLAPTAWLGGRLGASLTHRLPLRYVRLAFVVLVIAAAWKMAAVGE